MTVINQAEVFALVDDFEDVMAKLEKALGGFVIQTAILQMAVNNTDSELAQHLVWAAQKKMLDRG